MTEQDPPTSPRRRSLIMAGGGSKVAFQAGVLQVWLDETDVTFHHADAASGGVFNLAMWCQGMSGRQIADNWRAFRPIRSIEPDWRGLLLPPAATSLLSFDRHRRNVLRPWGLDWDRIRATDREATFNLYNFSTQEAEVRTADRMNEDLLISAVSLPMWFPPVDIDGDRYIDGVFATDANLIEAVDRGADELWIIWTVSQRGDWRRGFVGGYFQIIEAAANSRLRNDLDRIARNNAAVAAGLAGEFGRPIEVRLLEAEVPVHYLLNVTRDRMAAAVERGVEAGRAWCRDNGIALTAPAGPDGPIGSTGAPDPTSVASRRPAGVGVRFSERMTGHASAGHDDPRDGEREGRRRASRLTVELTIVIDDLDRFVVDPQRLATAHGHVIADALGGRLEIEQGWFNLFVDRGEPNDKRMLYRLWFRDGDGRAHTLLGTKVIRDDPGRSAWVDTTTLFTRVYRGRVTVEATDAPVVMAGVLRIRPRDLARQLTTFRASAPTRPARAAALLRFQRLFVSHVWDVYGARRTAARGRHRTLLASDRSQADRERTPADR